MDLFPDTKWTVLAEATLNGDESSREALELICLRYKNPIDKMIGLKGVDAARVEDVRQDFLMHLIQGSFFKKASSTNGKFRTFLLHALDNFLVDDFRKLNAEKRGGGEVHVELDEHSAISSPDTKEFDAVWAEALFNNALIQIRNEVYERRGEKAWEQLHHFLSSTPGEQNYEKLATALNITVGGAKAEVARMRSKFRDRLRAEVKMTVSAPHEIDEELSYLRETIVNVWKSKNV